MTPDLEKIFSSYFTDKVESDTLVTQRGILPGWLEHVRIHSFQQILEANVTLQKGRYWDLLTGKVYVVFDFYLTAVLALYPDETILWLDHHANNSNYEVFMRRENLLGWYPERKDQLIQLLVETKFNFLGQPQLIRSAVEIPETDNKNTGAQKRLTAVIPKLFSPMYTKKLDGNVQLKFCIWTRISGRVFAVTCSLGPENTFSYSGELLAEGTGNYFTPR
jgi:hypothetical protein